MTVKNLQRGLFFIDAAVMMQLRVGSGTSRDDNMFIYILILSGVLAVNANIRIYRQYTTEEGHGSVRKLWSFYWIKVSQLRCVFVFCL